MTTPTVETAAQNTTAYEVTAPSNIAFLKYWGKQNPDLQWPANDSLSMTLDRSLTTTRASVLGDKKAENDDITINAGRVSAKKALDHLGFLRDTLADEPGLNPVPLRIDSENSFPSACGIASSASGMASLTIAAIAAWSDSATLEVLAERGFNQTRLSHLSRLGSGSAGRSLWGGFVHWQKGQDPDHQGITPVDTPAWPLSDVIVVLSSEEKDTPSSVGHGTAWSSPLFEARLAGIEERRDAMLAAIQRQDLHTLGPLLETEALEMHSVMMTSTPPAHYWSEATPGFLAWVRRQRQKGDFPAWFTIDAGPNVHLICAAKDANAIALAVREDFPEAEIITDRTGRGPTLRKSQNL